MELANNDGFLKSIKKAGKDFIIGAGNSLDKNIFLGTVFTVGGINQSGMPKSIPYKIGELAGDIGSFAFGAAEAGTGVGGELLGFTADGTVVLAPAGVALNAASLGLVTHGGAATIKSAHNFSEDLFSLIKGEGNKGAGKPSSKLVGEELDLPWLSDNYRAVDVSSTVKVGGEVRDVSRRVYQRTDIDWDYISSHPDALGRSNRELAKQGNAPFHTDDARIELHHLTQTEPGGMVEIPGSLHDDYTNTLHGLVEDGGSFRNNPVLDKQYNNFNSKYWRWRIKQEK